ncbi:MAG: hypothetical protein U1E73_00785 [Planctomycetota bacterium]
MDLIHRVLGLTAAIGNGTARISVNFIKVNWLLMIGLGCAVFFAGNEARYALANSTTPREIAIADVAAQQEADKNFVCVRGELVDKAVFTLTDTRHGRTTKASYYPLLDDEHKLGVLVRTSGTQRPGAPGVITLTGMLMPMPSDLQRILTQPGVSLGKAAFDPDHVLEWNRRPGDPVAWSIGTGLLAVLLLAMLTTWRNRYIVFRPIGDAPASGTAAETQGDEPLPVWASGVFALETIARRFTNMRSVLLVAEGMPVACADVDASSSFMGVKTADRRGIWGMVMPVDRLRTIEFGFQYYGLGRRPAVRIRHAADNREMTAVLACEGDPELGAVAARLTTPPSPAPAPEPAR